MLRVSSGACRGCSIFQSRKKLESIFDFRKDKKISVTNGACHSLFFSPGNLSSEFDILRIAMIHALCYLAQSTPPLLKALPLACYLISLIRGQGMQASVLPWHISKQKPLERACFKWCINLDWPQALAWNPSSSMFLLWVYLQEISDLCCRRGCGLRAVIVGLDRFPKKALLGDAGNHPPAKDPIYSRLRTSWKGCPHSTRVPGKKTNEKTYVLLRGPVNQGKQWPCHTQVT